MTNTHDLAEWVTELLANDPRVAEVTMSQEDNDQVFIGLVLTDGTPVSLSANITP